MVRKFITYLASKWYYQNDEGSNRVSYSQNLPLNYYSGCAFIIFANENFSIYMFRLMEANRTQRLLMRSDLPKTEKDTARVYL